MAELASDNRELILSFLPEILREDFPLEFPCKWIQSAIQNNFIVSIEALISIKQELSAKQERTLNDSSIIQENLETMELIDQKIMTEFKKENFGIDRRDTPPKSVENL